MIFYFTATGNSKYIAGRIAAQTGEQVIDIAECVRADSYVYDLADGEALGFVVPVYFYGIPMIVAEFLRKLRVSGKTYSYAIFNCGGTAGNAEGLFRRAFPVDAAFGIAMVSNYVPLYQMESDAEIKECLEKAETEIDVIIQRIRDKSVGSFDSTKGAFPRISTLVAYPLYKYGRKTGKFSVNNGCTGCGLCVKICPRKAIQLESDKPVWTAPQCEFCLGCLHRCPAAAINYGKKSAENGRYVNPNVEF
ncbi:MAG: EFR1 family ferrodoxin [Firmicutes bacterium]|nr:EFR1 family ferrodoxin [Bacillota bacterium]